MRRLATAAFSFSAAVFAANYIFGRGASLYAAAVCALLGGVLLAFRLRLLKRAVIAVFAASIGFLCFSLHYDLTVGKARDLSGETIETFFYVTDYPKTGANYTKAEVRLYSYRHPHLGTVLFDEDGRLDSLRPGDIIRVKAKLSAADERYGVKTDRYSSQDVYLTGSIKGEISVIGRRTSVESAAAELAHAISDRADEVFSPDTAPFIKAIMTGDKSDLYLDDAVYVSLSRAGFMHIVAVSGMHVSFLAAFLRFLLGRGKKSSVVCLAAVWAFVAISGASPSSVRAAFMLSMMLAAPILGRENDPPTSLSAALAFLLILNPFAAASVSLQLSFAAMLGIVTVGDRLCDALLPLREKGTAARVLRYFAGIAACSLAVMIFTIPLTALHFGCVSVVSPITNMLCMWAAPICFVGGYIVCALSYIPFAGEAAEIIVSTLARYILFVCRTMSSLDFAAVYFTDALSWVWVAMLYASAALCAALKMKPAYRISVPIAAAVLGIAVSSGAAKLYYSSSDAVFAAVDVGQGQCVCAISKGRAVIVDCGSVSYAEYNAGDEAAAYLKSRGAERVDALIFTHLHADHANGFERLSNLVEIDRVVIPADAAGDGGALREIVHIARMKGIHIEYADRDATERYGGITTALFVPKGGESGNERCMAVMLTAGDYDLLVTGDAPASAERELAGRCDLSRTDALIVGHHGSKYSSCVEFLSALDADRAIISVGSNSFGHPAEETLERLEAGGYNVSRTDTDGDVEIRIYGKDERENP